MPDLIWHLKPIRRHPFEGVSFLLPNYNFYGNIVYLFIIATLLSVNIQQHSKFNIMKKILKRTFLILFTITAAVCFVYSISAHIGRNPAKPVTSNIESVLQRAQEADEPNMNFMYASNASLLGRIYMTYSGKQFKPCINTVSAFYNKHHTCSNCEDFVKNPERWNFRKTDSPKVGDMIIQHNSKTGKAYHAVILVKIEDGKYYINHAVKSNYFKNVELKTRSNLSFYEYIPCQQ